MKKTLWERFGDFMDTGWTWPVFFITFVLGYASCAIPVIPFNLVCVCIGSAAFFAMLSAHWPVVSYDSKGSVTLPSGEEYHYNIVKIKWYQRFPVLPFMSPFFLIPFRTDYYIVHNTRCATDITDKTKLADDILEYHHLQYERIYKTEYKKIKNDSQYRTEKFVNYLAKQRDSFNTCIKKFEDLGELEKIHTTDTYALYKKGEKFLLFFYSGEKEVQVGVTIKDEFALKVLNNEDYLSFETLMIESPEKFSNSYCFFDDNIYRLLWFRKNSDIEENDNDTVSSAKHYADVDETSDILGKDDRDILTNYVLGYSLRKRGKWKYMLGCILTLYLGLPIVTAGFISLNLLGLIVGIVGLVAVIFLFRKFLLKYKSYPKSLPPEDFTVVKAVCTGVVKKSDDKDVYTFSDGSTITKEDDSVVVKGVSEGVPCFLVLRNENNKPESAYSALLHKLADEVKFIDKMNG